MYTLHSTTVDVVRPKATNLKSGRGSTCPPERTKAWHSIRYIATSGPLGILYPALRNLCSVFPHAHQQLRCNGNGREPNSNSYCGTREQVRGAGGKGGGARGLRTRNTRSQMIFCLFPTTLVPSTRIQSLTEILVSPWKFNCRVLCFTPGEVDGRLYGTPSPRELISTGVNVPELFAASERKNNLQ